MPAGTPITGGDCLGMGDGRNRDRVSDLAACYRARAAGMRARSRFISRGYQRLTFLRFAETFEELAWEAEASEHDPAGKSKP